MLKQTALYQLHLDLGGRMTEFAGYQLPLQYRNGIAHEHLHCRNHAGFFDISHMGQFALTDDKAAAELERLTPSDMAGLKPGQMKYTVLTNHEGGIIDDIIVTRIVNGFLVVVNTACKDKDFLHISRQLSASCQLGELVDLSLFALQGPAAAAIIRKYSPSAAGLAFMQSCETEIQGKACRISRCGYTGEDGFEISVSDSKAEPLARLLLAEDEVEPIGLGARDTLRLEAGLCLYGHELDVGITPVEAGLNWLIKKGHDRFPGATRIIEQLQKNTDRKRVGLMIEGKQPVREGYAVYGEDNKFVGRVTSGSFSPSLDRPIAMALIETGYAAFGTRLRVKVRDKYIDASVTPLPFIPHRYSRKAL